MKILKWVAVIWLYCVGIASAQMAEQGIIVTGEGKVSAPPDMATITLGVTENAETAKEVMDKVNGSVAGLLAKLEALGVAPEDRQTSGFYLRPVHNNRASSSLASPKITGYQAGNSVTVRVLDLAKLGGMMDAVIEIGANDFNGLRFSLQDDSEALAEARKLAVGDAKQRAAQLADAAGISLGRIVRMAENSHQGGQMVQSFEAARSSMSDAIATGEVDVTAQVTMVFEIGVAE